MPKINLHHKIYFYKNFTRIFFYFFILFLLIQIFFWTKTEKIKTDFNLISETPNQSFIKIISLGDDEFLFRFFAIKLQNSGDVFAGFVNLKNYDYQKLYQWFLLLDSLNKKSNFTPSLAAYIYGQTQNQNDLKYIINYLDQHSQSDIENKWWWSLQAIYLSDNFLKDKNLSLQIIKNLDKSNSNKIPNWIKQYKAAIYEKYNEDCAAFAIIKNLIDDKKQMNIEEINFKRYFINDHLRKLKNKRFNPQKCQK